MAALSRAATSARPVATAPTHGGTEQVAGRADDGEDAGRRAGRSAAAPRAPARAPARAGARPAGGRARRRARTADRRTAPTAKTTAWAATSQPLPVSRATARTTVVTHAPNRGPRTSTSAGRARQRTRGVRALMEGDLRTADRARLDGRGADLSRSDRGSCRRGTGRLCGARSAGCPRREGNRSPATSGRRPGVGLDQGGQLLGPRRAAAAADQPPVAVEVEQRRGAPDVELAHRARGGSRRRRARTASPGPGGPAAAAAGRGWRGRARRRRWRTGRRSGRRRRGGRRGGRARPAGRSGAPPPPGPPAPPAAAPAGTRTAPLRVRSHQATAAVSASAATSTATPIPLTPGATEPLSRRIPTGGRASAAEHRVGGRHVDVARRRRRAARWSAAARTAAPGPCSAGRAVGWPASTRNAGSRQPAADGLLHVDDQLVAVQAHRAGGGQRQRLARGSSRSW